MPDLAVSFRVVRVTPNASHRLRRSLRSLQHDDTATRFQFAAGTSALRGSDGSARHAEARRLPAKIVINDRVGGTVANAEAAFTVIGTPASLLREAPALGAAFNREAALEPGTLVRARDRADAPVSVPSVRTRARDRQNRQADRSDERRTRARLRKRREDGLDRPRLLVDRRFIRRGAFSARASTERAGRPHAVPPRGRPRVAVTRSGCDNRLAGGARRRGCAGGPPGYFSPKPSCVVMSRNVPPT